MNKSADAAIALAPSPQKWSRERFGDICSLVNGDAYSERLESVGLTNHTHPESE